MSYPLEYRVAATAAADERAAFIRRTYGHLAGAILAFIGLEALLLQLPVSDQLVLSMVGNRMTWLIILGAFIGVGWLAEYWATMGGSPGVQYLGLSLYV